MMESRSFFAAPIVVMIVVVWMIILFDSSSRNDLLPELSGCYRGPATLQRSELTVSKIGEMSSGNVKVFVSIDSDKEGISFLPAKKVVMNLAGNSGIAKRSGYPFLLRIAKDHNSFLVPDESGPHVRFDRVTCGVPLTLRK